MTEARLAAAIADTARRTWRELGRSDEPFEVAAPPVILAATAAMLELEVETGSPDALRRAARLVDHATVTLPAMHVRTLGGDAEPARWLFHTPIPADRLPDTRLALARLAALTGTPADLPDGATLFDVYRARFFGRYAPMFGTYPDDLSLLADELAGAADRWEVVDRRFAAVLLHEHLHFGAMRRPLAPLYFDESVAAFLGVHLFPETAYPRAGRDNGLCGWPWFAQVGWSLCRAFGVGAVAAAQAGTRAFADVVPAPLLDAMARLGFAAWTRARATHGHPDFRRPLVWCTLIHAAHAGVDVTGWDLDTLEATSLGALPAPAPRDDAEAALDREALRHALLAMCLHNRQHGQAFRVTLRSPPGPVTIDADACAVSTPLAGDGYEIAAPVYVLPPAIAARLRASGRKRLELRLELDRVDEVCAELSGELHPVS